MATTPNGWPYVLPADHPLEFPALSQALADKLDHDLGAADVWTAWTPAVTNGTASAADCRYRRTPGGLLTIDAHLTMSAVTGNLTFSLPIAAAKATYGVAVFEDVSAGLMNLGMARHNAGSCGVYALGAASQINILSPTVPFTWAAGDRIHVTGSYAVAPLT